MGKIRDGSQASNFGDWAEGDAITEEGHTGTEAGLGEGDVISYGQVRSGQMSSRQLGI